MSFEVEWNEFLYQRFSNAINEHKKSTHWKERLEQIDECLNTRLTAEQKSFVDQILFEMGTSAEQEAKAVYLQGYKDCISLLKSIDLL